MIAAGAALAATGAAVPANASTGSDPIFAAIAKHRADETAFKAALGVDDRTPDFVEPRVLIETKPTTIAGVTVVLRYAAEDVERGGRWPCGYHGAGGGSVAFHQTIAGSLSEIAAGKKA